MLVWRFCVKFVGYRPVIIRKNTEFTAKYSAVLIKIIKKLLTWVSV